MTTEVVLIALLLNALTVLLVLYLVYKGGKALGEFEPYLQDVEQMRHAIARRGNDILEKTITVAQEIIRNAIATSQRNLRLSQSMEGEMEKTLQAGLEQNLSEVKQMVKNATEGIIEAYRNQFLAMSREIEASGLSAHKELLQITKDKVDELSAGIVQQLAEVRSGAEEKIGRQLVAAEEEIASYKQQKIKEIDNKVYQMVGEIAKKVVGHAIDLSTHQGLVLEALEKAKKEKLF